MMWLVGVSLNLEENPYALWLPPKRSVVWSCEERELDNETHYLLCFTSENNRRITTCMAKEAEKIWRKKIWKKYICIHRYGISKIERSDDSIASFVIGELISV